MNDRPQSDGASPGDQAGWPVGGDFAERELLRLFAAVCDDSLAGGEAERLAELLESNPPLRQRYIDYMHLDTNLRYELTDGQAPSTPSSSLPGEPSSLLGFGASPLGIAPSSPSQAPLPTTSDPKSSSEGLFGSLFESVQYYLPVACRSTAFGMMLCAALGAGIASWIVLQMARSGAFAPDQPPMIVQVPGQNEPVVDAPYVATLVQSKNCIWDKSRSAIDFQGRGLKPGQSLHLLEGVAQINSKLPSGAMGEFQLEGPLALVLTSEGMPSLQFGKLTGSFRGDFERFSLDTPLGQVVVSGDVSIGIVAGANEVEVHVFSGMAMFEYFEHWSNGDEPFPNYLKATPGTSLLVKIDATGSLTIEHGRARENRFATTADSADSQLAISDDYVRAIRHAKPLGYWRFESDEGGIVRNEMSDRLHCRMVGDAIRLHSGPGNRTAEFGVASGPGYLLSDDVVEGVGDSYATEAWVKPTFFHHATLFSLVEPNDSLVMQHRFLLELCGPGPGQPTVRPWEAHPNQVRFLHRGINRGGPSQCYSPIEYAIRKWQHLAVVKDKAELRLFVDGEHVASAKDRIALGNRLHVLMGQLYPKDAHGRDVMQARLFVGQLDEVAFYDRALTNQEIKEHFHLGRPESDVVDADR